MRRVSLLLLSGLLAVAALTACGGGSATRTPTAPVAAGRVWPAPADPSAAAAQAGLPMLDSERLEVHHHAHLDVFVDGDRVAVPAGIGIDGQRQRISPLHTHDDTGVIHMESAVDRPFTLGQLFTAWGVPLSAGRVADLRAGGGKSLRVYVDGRQVGGDPGAIVVKDHQEIAVVFGAAGVPAHVPSSYPFPPGL